MVNHLKKRLLIVVSESLYSLKEFVPRAMPAGYKRLKSLVIRESIDRTPKSLTIESLLFSRSNSTLKPSIYLFIYNLKALMSKIQFYGAQRREFSYGDDNAGDVRPSNVLLPRVGNIQSKIPVRDNSFQLFGHHVPHRR